jgi:dienelactone hydrolase
MSGSILIAGGHNKFLVILVLFAVLGTTSCVTVDKGPITDGEGHIINRDFLPHSTNNNKTVELFWTKPAGDGPFPAILFVHGHQIKIRNGGETYAKAGRLSRMTSRGYVAAAISLPGYGDSDGPPDFCGPLSQQAVLAAIDFLRKQAFVEPDKVALYGFSRGAIVASMVATRDERLSAVVLGSGAYDFFKFYPTFDPIANNNIIREAGTSAEAFRARSAVYHVNKIKSPVLLLHGALDPNVPVEQPEAFAEKLRAHDKVFRIKIFPRAGHDISLNEQYSEMLPFLSKYLAGRSVSAGNDIVSTFSGRTVCFEKWITSPRIKPFLGADGFVEIYVGNDGVAEVRGKERIVKVPWAVHENGDFCVGMKEKKVFWGCKKVFELKDGSFYGEGSSPEESGKIFVK